MSIAQKEYKDFFVTKEGRPTLVIDADRDATIQKMKNDVTAKNINSYIGLELKDIETIINAKDSTLSFSSVNKGENAHYNSLEPIIAQYKDSNSINAIMICFTINDTYPIIVLSKAIEKLYKVFKGEEDIIYSILLDNGLELDEVRINAIIKT